MPASADQGDLGALLEFDQQLRRTRHFVMFVIADQRFRNVVVVQQLLGMASVFASDEVNFFQDAERPQRNVFEVADRCPR